MTMSLDTIRRIQVEASATGIEKTTGQLNELSAAQDNVAKSANAMATVTDLAAKRQLSAADQYQRQTLSVVDGARAQAAYEKAVRVATMALNQGVITQDDHAKRVDLLKQKYGQASTASQLFSMATSGVSANLIAMSAGLGPVGVAVAGLGPIGLGVTAVFGAVVKAFTYMSDAAERMGQRAADISNFAAATGFTVDQVRALTRQATLLNLSGDQTRNWLERFAVNLDAARRGTGPLAEAMDRIDHQLLVQLEGTKTNAAAWDVFAAASTRAGLSVGEFMKVALGKGSGPAVLLTTATAAAGGLDAMTAAQNRFKQGTSDQVEEWKNLNNELVEAKQRADQAFAKMFTSDVLRAEIQFYQNLEGIAPRLREIPSTAAAVGRSLHDAFAPLVEALAPLIQVFENMVALEKIAYEYGQKIGTIGGDFYRGVGPAAASTVGQGGGAAPGGGGIPNGVIVAAMKGLQWFAWVGSQSATVQAALPRAAALVSTGSWALTAAGVAGVAMNDPKYNPHWQLGPGVDFDKEFDLGIAEWNKGQQQFRDSVDLWNSIWQKVADWRTASLTGIVGQGSGINGVVPGSGTLTGALLGTQGGAAANQATPGAPLAMLSGTTGNVTAASFNDASVKASDLTRKLLTLAGVVGGELNRGTEAFANEWRAVADVLGSAQTPADHFRTTMLGLAAAVEKSKGNAPLLEAVGRAKDLAIAERGLQVTQGLISALGPLASVQLQVDAAEQKVYVDRAKGINVTDQQKNKLMELARETALGTLAMKAQSDAFQVEAATLGMSVGAATKYRLVQEQVNEANRVGKTVTDDMREAWDKAATGAGNSAAALERLKVASQIKFDRATFLLSPADLEVVQKLAGLYGNDIPRALASSEGQQIKLNAALKDAKDTGIDFAQTFVHGLMSGKNVVASLTDSLDKLAQKMADKAITDLLSGNFEQAAFDAVVAVASFIGSALGKESEQVKKAKDDWTKMQSAAKDFIQTMSGTVQGDLTKRLTDEFNQGQQYFFAAIAAHDYASAAALYNAYLQDQAKQIAAFNATFAATVKAFTSGQGTSGAAITAIQNVAQVAQSVLGFVTDAGTAGADVGKATEAAKQYLLTLITGGEQLSDVGSKLAAINASASALGGTLTQLGETAQQAASDIASSVTTAIANLHQGFTDDLNRQLNEATGKDFVNSILDLIGTTAKQKSDAALFGNVDTSLVDTLFVAQAQKIVDGAGLVGAAFDDKILILPELAA